MTLYLRPSHRYGYGTTGSSNGVLRESFEGSAKLQRTMNERKPATCVPSDFYPTIVLYGDGKNGMPQTHLLYRYHNICTANLVVAGTNYGDRNSAAPSR